MNGVLKRMLQCGALLLALVLGNRTASAVSGTLQERVLTFSDTSANTLTFTVNAVAAGATASLLLDFAPDGSASLPASEPFTTPSAVTFALSYGSTAISGFSFTAAQAAALGGFAASSAAAPQVDLIVTKPASTFGRYVITLAFPGGASALTADWTLAISGVPSSARAMVYVDKGRFKGLADTGPCGCPTGQCCSVCGGGGGGTGPHWNICIRHPEICEVVAWTPYWTRFPPEPCLSCPKPWQVPRRDDVERVLVSFTALERGQPVGEGRAKEIRMNISGGQPVGELVDIGGGQYSQLIEYSKGAPAPRVSQTFGGVTSEEIVAGVAANGPSKGLVTLLSVLLVLALAVAAYLAKLARRTRGRR